MSSEPCIVGWRESSVCVQRPKKGLSTSLIQNSEVTWIWNPQAAPFSLPWSFTASAPFHYSLPWSPSVTVTDDWTRIRRESATRCVFPWRLMSALDQKSQEATLALGGGEGAWGPFTQAPEDRLSSHPSHPISYQTETCVQGGVSLLLASPISLLWFYLFLHSTSIYWVLAMCQALGKQHEQNRLGFCPHGACSLVG